jgi:hypothetical protein
MLLTALDRERKRSRFVLTLCGVYTLVSLIGSALIYSTHDVALLELWPVVVAQVVALTVLAYLVRTRFLRRNAETVSVRDAAASALAETRSGMKTVKLIVVAMAAMLALLATAVISLSKSGKMDGQSVWSFTAVCLLVVVFNGTVLLLKWKRKLRPRRDRLSEIVRDLDSQ